jgi:hypothetical protein
MTVQDCNHPSKFDAESADLRLIVGTSEKGDLAIGQAAGEVSSLVKTHPEFSLESMSKEELRR